jgi:hypothetical protein
MKLESTLLFLAFLSVGTVSSPAVEAGTLENMERERAIMLETLLSPELDVTKRQKQVTVGQRRLVDMERMVLRDTSLKGQNTPTVRTAFNNYDLTFLMHASTEKDKLLIDHWLEQVGITTSALMSTRVGRE